MARQANENLNAINWYFCTYNICTDNNNKSFIHCNCTQCQAIPPFILLYSIPDANFVSSKTKYMDYLQTKQKKYLYFFYILSVLHLFVWFVCLFVRSVTCVQCYLCLSPFFIALSVFSNVYLLNTIMRFQTTCLIMQLIHGLYIDTLVP